MANYEWMTAGEKKILFMRTASGSVEELRGKLKEFSSVIHAQPEHSVLAVSDVAGGHFDKEMKTMLADFVKSNEPYMKMSVIIGIEGLQKVVYSSVLRVTGRKNLVLKKSLEEALAYLTENEDG